MHSIADISIFKTPFESAQSFQTKFERIETMFEDYTVNAGMALLSENSENEHFRTVRYFDSEKRLLDISFSFQKNLGDISYFPAGIVNYRLNPFVFEKENIEHFLDDNIAFIWNVFATEFFIDYDTWYRIDDRNKGKKLDYKNLRAFDMAEPESMANKQLLDSMMYIYFSLVRSIFDLENNGEKLDQFLKSDTLSDIASTFALFQARTDQTKENLVSQATLVKGQIDAFVRLVSKS